MYNYLKHETDDVVNFIKDTYTTDEIREYLEDRMDFEEKLDDLLWADDTVTGNGSLNYANSKDSKRYVMCNLELLVEALTEYGQLKELGYKIHNAEWGWLDTTIRCYLLGQAIHKAVCRVRKEINSHEV